MKSILLSLLLLVSMLVWAQNGKLSDEKRNEFEAQKIAFFTQKLDLTPSEAATFWPLYNEMNKKIREKERAIRALVRQSEKMSGQSNVQMQKIVGNMLALEQSMLDIKKDYYLQLMKVVSADKICKLGWVEHYFHKQLLERLKNRPEKQSK